MKLDSNTILLLLVTLLVGGGAYWYFFMNTSNNPPLTTSGTVNPAQAQFTALVSQLQPISFDTSIFSDPRFMALTDLTTPIEPESSGRTDPFGTFSGSVSAAPALKGK